MKFNSLHADLRNYLFKFGIPVIGPADLRVLLSADKNSEEYWRDAFPADKIHYVNSRGEDELTTKRNDVLLITPESHTWYGDSHVEGAALTWDKQTTHMVGLGPSSKSGYGRCRFGHSGKTMANFMTISGAYNFFANLRWMHGSSTGGASDITCVTVTGAGNMFDGCNFAGPCDSTQGASNNYLGVYVNGATSSYFKDCLFGTNNAVDRNGTSCMLKLAGAGGLNVFENCIFRSHSTDSAFFINWANTEQAGFGAIFLNCQFLNRPAAAEGLMDYAITSSAHANDYLYFDSRCTFAGVDDVIAAASEAKVIVGTVPYSAAATSNLLQATADYS